MHPMSARSVYAVISAVVIFIAYGCGTDEGNSPDSINCGLFSSNWTPTVTGSGLENHEASVEVDEDEYTASGDLTGLGQATQGREIAIQFEIPVDLGEAGSLTLVADPVAFPETELSGSAYPILVSLSDGIHEFVNLARSGNGAGDCWDTGYFSCSGDDCSVSNPGCSIHEPSSFANRTHWQQFNVGSGLGGYTSINTFPTCNWANGASLKCEFGTDGSFSTRGRIPTGGYIAKYVLLASHYKVTEGYKAGLKLTVIRKKDPLTRYGSFDVNVILVDENNRNAAATAKGQQNLDALFAQVYDHYKQPNAGIKLGQINAYDWRCETGNSYSTVNVIEVGDFLKKASALVPSTSGNAAVNVFLVSSLSYDQANLTVLGISGAIGGPPINNTGKSGVVFSSFNMLERYNSRCTPGVTCSPSLQDSDFVEMSSTISHEIGHYLGLNHLTEGDSSASDPIPDTPVCSASGGKISHSSCLVTGLNNCSVYTGCLNYDGKTTFCPDQVDCQFNHVMWYTTKNYNESSATGDANIFSSQSGIVLNYSTFVR